MKESYLNMKVGDYIEIINMDGESSYCGKVGKILFIDDLNQIHGTWGGCALIPGVDNFKKINKKDEKNEL